MRYFLTIFVSGLTVLLIAGTLAMGSSAATQEQSTKITDEDPVIARGLNQFPAGYQVTENAVAYANELLADSGLQLAAINPKPAGNSEIGSAIPVYSVQSPPSKAATPAAVPKGCRCIFVNVPVLETWARAHSTGVGRFELDIEYLLTFMLLHEVGHIREGTSAAEFADGALLQLNIDPSLAKAREEKADEFAAALIRDLAILQPVRNGSFTANWIAIELQHLSWNMQAYATLDEFGSYAIGKPSVFFDHSYSHPNLAWRILRSNHLILGSPESRSLLDAFEDARQRGANPKPFWQKEN